MTNKRQVESINIKPISGVHTLYLVYRHPDNNPDHITNLHVQFDWFYPTFKELTENKEFLSLLYAEVPSTPILLESPNGFRRKSFVFERGNWTVKGDEVTPMVPASLNPWPKGAPKNRLGLAKWISEKDNPLTARTMVNRVWEQIFGKGLVETLKTWVHRGQIPATANCSIT